MRYKHWKKNSMSWSEECWKYQAYIGTTKHVIICCTCRKGSLIVNLGFNNAVVKKKKDNGLSFLPLCLLRLSSKAVKESSPLSRAFPGVFCLVEVYTQADSEVQRLQFNYQCSNSFTLPFSGIQLSHRASFGSFRSASALLMGVMYFTCQHRLTYLAHIFSLGMQDLK